MTETRQLESRLMRAAHEIAQPLNALAAAARVVRTASNPAIVDRAGAIIERQARYLQSLVHDLIESARPEASSGFTRLDLRECVTEVLDATQLMCAERQIAMEAVLPNEPVWIEGDTVRLQEILWNLISNAMRHTPAGGRIEVRVTRHHDRVLLTVRDTGSGLEASEIRRIFDPFVRGEGALGEGLGLGLYVVSELARAHRGEVDVQSPGRGLGSEFRLILPSAA